MTSSRTPDRRLVPLPFKLPADYYTVGERDWTRLESLGRSEDECDATTPADTPGWDGPPLSYCCTRGIGHVDRHVAGDGTVIKAVW